MEPIFTVGIIIFTGFLGGEICSRIGLPKVTGYILAGVFLNPNLTHLIPASFVSDTNLVTNIALAFITFSVGGTLAFTKVRSLGKPIIFITLFEAEFAYLSVALSSLILGPVLVAESGFTFTAFFIPFALLLASLASPTDPSATLAVEHEYHAKGKVTSTIMGVAAFDDVLGLINYSISVAVAGVLISHNQFGLHSVIQPFLVILGSLTLGTLVGILLNLLIKLIKKETEGVLITLIISLLALCYGMAEILNVDELLSTMMMGVIVVNYSVKRERIFKILERYTEELIFVLFFTISAMHLDFSVIMSNYIFILVFVLFRSAGKFAGTVTGGVLSKSSANVKKFAFGGLIPQGGIVIGLALLLKQNPSFESISTLILNIIIGATIIHEIVGPVISKFVLVKSGEIKLTK